MFLPDMRSSFEQDIIINIKKLTCDFSRNIWIDDLEESCVIYSVDMCLEFKDKSHGLLLDGVIDEIVEQVTDVYKKLFSSDFTSENARRCGVRTHTTLSCVDARVKVDNYYKRINKRYNMY